MVFISFLFVKDILIYYYFLYRNMNETEQNQIANTTGMLQKPEMITL